MKKTQRKEIKEKTMEELVADGRNLRQEIFNLRLRQASAQLEKPARLRTLRRDIARIETRMSSLQKKPKPAKTISIPDPIANPPPAPAAPAAAAQADRTNRKERVGE